MREVGKSHFSSFQGIPGGQMSSVADRLGGGRRRKDRCLETPLKRSIAAHDTGRTGEESERGGDGRASEMCFT